mmetsp:Transcript_11336/g.25170  ORF Transcript_11336/g.25170 Transcript_11336/m.25170 type:complete len:764 (+) Transcript_11336:270-2561(+)
MIVLLLSLVAVAQAGGCGDCVHGSCDGTVCRCNPGWAGNSCDFHLAGRDSKVELVQRDAGRLRRRTGREGNGTEAAQCEEGCSGHGRCGPGGVCLCSPNFSGQMCEYNNAECSNGDPEMPLCSGHGSCVNEMCVCDPAFSGVLCDAKRCPDDCSGHGTCQADATCMCDSGFSGLNCGVDLTVAKMASTKPDVEQQMLMARQKAQAFAVSQLAAQGPMTQCPEKCNGNGVCNSDSQPPLCVCYAGYTGVACQNFCPNECTGRGECVDGSCLCFAGFGGVDCSVPMCCNGHGDCSIPGTCICEPGWMGADCGIAIACPDPECNSHGQCLNGNCECDGGWTGARCEKPPTECGVCPPGGVCDRMLGKCLCDGRPCTDEEQAAAAAAAGGDGGGLGGGLMGPGLAGPGAGPSAGGAPDLTDSPNLKDIKKEKEAATTTPAPTTTPEPDPDAPAPAPDAAPEEATTTTTTTTPKPSPCGNPECSGHGKCENDECVCDDMFYGKFCEKQHCAGFDEEEGTPDCHGKGMCIRGKCQCMMGWGTKGGGEESCKDCTLDCGDHGHCEDGVCVCEEGYKGEGCRELMCFKDCSGHGVCSYSSINAAPECKCDYGWAGQGCDRHALYFKLETERPCPNNCNANGLCFDGQCVCSGGFSGADCSARVCDGDRRGPNCDMDKCPNDCSGNGMCFLDEDKQRDQRFGKDERPVAVCQCDPNFTGEDCGLPVACYDACWNDCKLDSTNQKCAFCKGQCQGLVTHSVIGHHSPYQDLVS